MKWVRIILEYTYGFDWMLNLPPSYFFPFLLLPLSTSLVSGLSRVLPMVSLSYLSSVRFIQSCPCCHCPTSLVSGLSITVHGIISLVSGLSRVLPMVSLSYLIVRFIQSTTLSSVRFIQSTAHVL